jgi:predicted amidohydrolase
LEIFSTYNLDLVEYFDRYMVVSRKIKIALYQGSSGLGIPEDIIAEIKETKPDILCLPEYFMVDPDEQSILPSADKHDQHLDYLKSLSLKLGCAITGATLLKRVIGGYNNICYFVSGGEVEGYYKKIHPYKNEGRGKVIPGYEYKVIRFGEFRIGLLICADVLFPWSFTNMRGLRPDLIVVPTTSSYRADESIRKKYSRDQRFFVKGSQKAGCPVIKVSSVGKIATKRVQGRSLVATPNGIIFRVSPHDESKPVFKIIGLEL